MIQPHSFLYNNKTQEQKREFLDKFSVVKILDFISIGKLFKEANVKVIAIEVRNIKKNDKHIIKHLTFRKTVSVKERMFFELDYYDYHNVSQNNALNYDFVWKANLLGGGRLFHLAKRLKENYRSIEDYFSEKYKLEIYEGYSIGGKESKKDYDEFFQGKNKLKNRALKENKIDETKLVTSYFPNGLTRTRDKQIYKSPLIIIGKTDTLSIALYNNDVLLYSLRYLGIPFPKDKLKEIKSFYDNFVKNQNTLSAIVNLLGFTSLTVKATAVSKNDIVKLPYPENGDFDMSQWENELVDDIKTYMCNYINHGLKNDKLMKEVSKDNIEKYNNTFIRLMKTTFEDFDFADEKVVGGFRFQAYSFYKNNDFKFEGQYKIDNLMKATYSKYGESLYTQRILRLYTENN